MAIDIPAQTPLWKRRIRSTLTYIPLRLPAVWISHHQSTCNVNGFTLTVRPGVFHPLLYRSSLVLARYVERMPLRGKRVLDMGTGSGIIALHAARAGARVVAVDINPVAVTTALVNAHVNRLDERIRFLSGDLFQSIPKERFDLIVWNPPFCSGERRSPSDVAWRTGNGHELLRRFAVDVPAHLNPGGKCLLILSSDSDLAGIFALFNADFEPPEILLRSRSFLEEFYIVSFAPRRAAHSGE